MRDDFPIPTAPTTATRLPSGTTKFMLECVGSILRIKDSKYDFKEQEPTINWFTSWVMIIGSGGGEYYLLEKKMNIKAQLLGTL